MGACYRLSVQWIHEKHRGAEGISVFAEDVRLKLSGSLIVEHEQPVQPRRSARLESNPVRQRFTLSSHAHNIVLQLISPVDSGAAGSTDPHRLTGFKYVDEDDGVQYMVEGFLAETVVNGQKCRSFTVRNLETNEVADDGGMSEAYLLDKLAEAKDAAGLTQL